MAKNCYLKILAVLTVFMALCVMNDQL